jgi:hypothetical protein
LKGLSSIPKFIFVSHSGDDAWVARQIAREIESRGATPFLDQADIEIGSEFEERILGVLEKTDELLVLFTPWSLQRPYVWAEIGAAWIRRIPIIVVLHGLSIDQFQSQATAPVFLKKRDIVELNNIERYFDELSARVSAPTHNV